MLIETTRFGQVEIDETKVISIPEGILGFPRLKRYALLQTTDDSLFYWLQSLENPAIAFVVCDPLLFVPDYTAPIRREDMESLELADLTDCQVFVVVNKVDGYLTANLQGPLVVGAQSLRAKQLVLAERRYSTRHRLLKADDAAAPALQARKVG
jgi:flagellar assembly factor FliW